ncbi:MAG TPA: crossover junction endodeoxyribonuclease RuvC [Gemmatimonadota bacterium]|nr:crossover junction endodeoxyribonuclease RuvC [Gemmatimonadota bacterium]
MSARGASLRVLGVDPGSHVTGYGVVERRGSAVECVDCGTISGGAGELPDRLVAVYDGMTEVLQAFRPGFVAIENAFLGRNVRTLASMSQTRGVLILAARRAELPVFEYTPREVKQSVVGNGGATKSQIAYMVRSLLALADAELPADATDSLAVALCHLHRNGTPRTARR